MCSLLGYLRTLDDMAPWDLRKAIVPMVKVRHTCLYPTFYSITLLKLQVVSHLNLVESPNLTVIWAPEYWLRPRTFTHWCISVDVKVNSESMLLEAQKPMNILLSFCSIWSSKLGFPVGSYMKLCVSFLLLFVSLPYSQGFQNSGVLFVPVVTGYTLGRSFPPCSYLCFFLHSFILVSSVLGSSPMVMTEITTWLC